MGTELEVGKQYIRRELHAKYGGQAQGGISTPKDQPFLLLFTGESGAAYGYHDGWTDGDDVYRYFGEGQSGDMEFVRGNLAIRDHSKTGKALYLFKTLGKGKPVRFLGEFSCVSWEYLTGPDEDGMERRSILFHLAPVQPKVLEEMPVSTGLPSDLRAAALAAASPVAESIAVTSQRTLYKRAAAVRDYVLARATGKCECCQSAAPFTRRDGTPYLEPHHVKMVSEGGPDHPRWVGAVCPTCHRHIHHGVNGDQLNLKLMTYIHTIEPEQD